MQKRTIILLIFLAILVATIPTMFGQSPSSKETTAPGGGNANSIAFEMDKKLVAVDKQLYVCKFEVSVGDFKRFIADQKAKGVDVSAIDYDAKGWLKFPIAENDKFAKEYYTKSQYKSFPIINISWAAAEAYCKWLTDAYNADPKAKLKGIKFMLPSEDDFIKATGLRKGLELPFKENDLLGENNNYNANIKYDDEMKGGISYDADGATFTTNVNNTRFKPSTRLGLVHLYGNVAEMIDVEGNAKGGSWENFAKECGNTKVQALESPDPRLVFNS